MMSMNQHMLGFSLSLSLSLGHTPGVDLTQPANFRKGEHLSVCVSSMIFRKRSWIKGRRPCVYRPRSALPCERWKQESRCKNKRRVQWAGASWRSRERRFCTPMEFRIHFRALCWIQLESVVALWTYGNSVLPFRIISQSLSAIKFTIRAALGFRNWTGWRWKTIPSYHICTSTFGGWENHTKIWFFNFTFFEKCFIIY